MNLKTDYYQELPFCQRINIGNKTKLHYSRRLKRGREK